MPALFEFNVGSAKVLAEDFDSAFDNFLNSLNKLKNGEPSSNDFVNGNVQISLIHNNSRRNIRDMDYFKKYLLKGIDLRLECLKCPILNYDKYTYQSMVYLSINIKRNTDLSFLLKRKIKVRFLQSLTDKYPTEIEGTFLRETDNCIIIQYLYNYREKREMRIPKLRLEGIECRNRGMRIYIPSHHERRGMNIEEIENQIAEQYPENPDFINIIETNEMGRNYIRQIYTGASDTSLSEIDVELTRKVFYYQ